MKSIINLSLDKLNKFCLDRSFKGYDPYDTLNSWIPFHWFGKWGPVLAIQFQKRNPFNIRPLLGIKKDYNPKGLGLMIKAFSLAYKRTKNEKYKTQAYQIFELLKSLTSEGYSGACWGYNFDWASPGSYLKKYTPSVVVTSFVVDGLLEFYNTFKEEAAKDLIVSSARFVIKDIPVTELENGISFAYTKYSTGCCYNASLLAAEILVKANIFQPNQYNMELAKHAVDFVIGKQQEDGSWNYSYNPQTGEERKQIDFHQGFILVSLNNYLKYSELSNPYIENAITKGLKYYREIQFFDNGVSQWRVPKIWPVEIHNQAQGIITFSLLNRFDKEYLNFADIILKWTIQNMQDKKGFFYYQKFKWHTNKIPYIRWSQAWMLLAFEEFLRFSKR